MTPRVTVGLPFADHAATLALAVASIFAQHLTDWELLLVNDGSADGSLELARRIRDPRVRVLGDGTRRGLAHRLNQVALEARGALVARMDADDVMHPARLGRQVEAFTADPALEVLGTGMVILDAAGAPRARRLERPLPDSAVGVLGYGFLSHPTVMARRDWARAHRYDETLARAEDQDLWCRVAGRVRVGRLEDPLMFYREPVPVNLPAYLDTFAATRRILSRHVPWRAAPLARARLEARARLRPPAFRLARLLGLEGPLVARRNRPLTDGERAEAETALELVRACPVPGWEDA